MIVASWLCRAMARFRPWKKCLVLNHYVRGRDFVHPLDISMYRTDVPALGQNGHDIKQICAIRIVACALKVSQLTDAIQKYAHGNRYTVTHPTVAEMPYLYCAELYHYLACQRRRHATLTEALVEKPDSIMTVLQALNIVLGSSFPTSIVYSSHPALRLWIDVSPLDRKHSSLR
jgi:hypothetical protein